MQRSLRMFVFPGLCLLVGQLSLEAQECRTDSLHGGYAFSAEGDVTIPNLPITGPFRRVSRGVFDGAGNLAVTSFASYNGLVFSEPFVGTYSVRSDCTMTFTFNVPDPLNFPISFAGVVSTDFRDITITVAGPPGSAIIGRFRKQRVRGCSAGDLIGSYLFELTGKILQPAPLAGPFARAGRLVADGAGRFAAATTVSYNGLIGPESLSGTYSVDAACQVTFNYDVSVGGATTTITLWGPLSDAGDGAFLIQTVPQGAAISGSLSHAPRR